MLDPTARSGARAPALALVVTVTLLVLGAPSAGAVADAGAGTPTSPSTSTPTSTSRIRYRPPVRAAVLDPFRAPATQYGPGNRGIEYGTAAGDPVGAIGAGTVVFAGPVAGRLVVSVVHPDGLRSSLTGLASVAVHVGQTVVAGQPVGRAAQRLHLGVRRGDTYLDPAALFTSSGPARLVPRRRGPGVPDQHRPGFWAGRPAH